MRRVGVFGWLLLIGTLTLLSACSNSTQQLRDDQIVHCLSPTRRPELAAAAAALDKNVRASGGLIVAGGATMEPRQWRDKDPTAFARACQAMTYVPPAKAPDNPLPAVVSILLPVLAGGAVALFSTEWRNASTVAVKHADDLGDAADAFFVAAREYVVARGKNQTPQAGPYEEAFEKLAAQLAKVGRFRPGWGKVAEARRTLMEHLTREKAHNGDVQQRLDDLSNQLARFDQALRRPWRPHRGVR